MRAAKRWTSFQFISTNFVNMVKSILLRIAVIGLGLCLIPTQALLAFSGKSQIVQDLEGLDPSQALLSASSLRGSYIVKRYVSGPFKGGRAVIEVAQDLTYAEIRIFDKGGQLQRIYSIQSKSAQGSSAESAIQNPQKMVEKMQSESASSTQPSGAGEKPPVPQETKSAGKNPEGATSGVQAQPPSPSGAVKPIPAAPPPAAAAPSPSQVTPPPARSERLRVVKVRRKRRRKQSALDTPLSGAPPVFEEEVVTEVVTKEVSGEPASRHARSPSTSAQEGERKSNQSALTAPTREAARPAQTAAVKNQVSAPTEQLASLIMAPPPGPPQPAPSPSRKEGAGEGSVKSQSTNASETSPRPQNEKAPLESDQWSPIQGVRPAPLPDSVLKDLEAATHAIQPAKPASHNAADDLVQLAHNASAWQPDSDLWAPVQGRPKLDAREERIQKMLSSLKPVVPPVARPSSRRPRQDEGVSPFSYLEKFSGPQYGRHREFERRVIAKHNRHSFVKGYDFYVDEVDRKQEKHYLYYYKVEPKSQEPRLIALEKHEHVTFLSNYDIDSEGKSKIIRY